MPLPPSAAFAALNKAAAERILILDGAMGTQIQALALGEDDYSGHGSGHACRHHSDHPQTGNNDLLILTQPEAVEQIHYNYAIAGADIVETNTFSSTTIEPWRTVPDALFAGWASRCATTNPIRVWTG